MARWTQSQSTPQLVIASLVAAALAGCGPGQGAVVPTAPPVASYSVAPTQAVPSPTESGAGTPTDAASPSPSPSATRSIFVEITFHLTIDGTVPAAAVFALIFNHHASDSEYYICPTVISPSPCIGGGAVYIQQFETPLTSEPGSFAYQRIASGQVVEVFLQGAVDLSKSGTISATYTFN